LWLSVGLSLVLQSVVLYVPAMQRAFGTVPLTPMDWARCIVAASAVFWIREVNKLVTRRFQRGRSRSIGATGDR